MTNPAPLAPHLLDQQAIFHRKVLWWVLALICTIAGTVTPFMLRDNIGTAIWAFAIFGCGALLGLLDSKRPWIFPLLLAASYAIAGSIVGGIEQIYDVILRLQLGLTLAIPAAIGAYAGAFLRKLARGRFKLHGAETPSVVRTAALLIGAISAASVSIISQPTGSMLAVVLLFAAAAVLGYHYSDRLWRWVLYLGYGIPFAVLVRLAFELRNNPESHGLFPIEISLAIAIAILPALSGAMLGRLFHQARHPRNA